MVVIRIDRAVCYLTVVIGDGRVHGVISAAQAGMFGSNGQLASVGPT